MARDELALYLTLTPEFGGHRFGPFEGLEVRLGTDRDRCHIVISEGLGVVRDHCKVLRQGPNSLILTPAERTAAVWLWRATALRPTQVQTPTAVRPGDAFSLVTPEGPRFFIELAPLPPDVLAARKPATRGFRRLTPARLIQEIYRFILARLYTFNPIAIAARGWYFITSGAIFQPRILIGLVVAGFTMLTMAAGSCRIANLTSEVSDLTTQNSEIKSNLAACQNLSGKSIGEQDFADLAQQLTRSTTIQRALSKDGAFKQKVKEHAQIIANGMDRYAWLQRNPDVVSAFSRWRQRVVEAEPTHSAIDSVTRTLLVYAAATPNRIDPVWSQLKDSSGAEACVRGPLQLTWRQAINLGLTAQPDAFVRGDAAALANDANARLQLLIGATTKALRPAPLDTTPTAPYPISAGERTCVYATDADERDDSGAVARMLVDQVGKSTKGLPGEDSDAMEIARIARLYASDIPDRSFVDLKKPSLNLTNGSLSSTMKEVPGGDWVMDRTAEVIARSMVLPCDAVLNGNPVEMEKVLGKLPDPVPCLILFYRLSHDP